MSDSSTLGFSIAVFICINAILVISPLLLPLNSISLQTKSDSLSVCFVAFETWNSLFRVGLLPAHDTLVLLYASTCAYEGFRFKNFPRVIPRTQWRNNHPTRVDKVPKGPQIVRNPIIFQRKIATYFLSSEQHPQETERMSEQQEALLMQRNERCEHTVSWNRVQCCINVRRIAFENVCKRRMTFKVIQGHCRCYHLICHILFHISLSL